MVLWTYAINKISLEAYNYLAKSIIHLRAH